MRPLPPAAHRIVIVRINDFAECRTYQFCFDGKDCIYIDHRGERVLADVEGSGSFKVVHGGPQVNAWVDGTLTGESSGVFRQSFVATSKHPGPSQISVRLGPPPENLQPHLMSDSFQGCGWIVDSERLDSVDEFEANWSCMRQADPVPVFFEARGRSLSIIRVPFQTVKLAELVMSDPATLQSAAWKVQNASRLFPINDAHGSQVQVLSHLNASSFTFKKPVGCAGILIRKQYDCYHGRQRARISVNAIFKGWWYEPRQNRLNRLQWAQFGFGCESEDEQLQLTIDPPAGSPLWSVCRYEVWGLLSES